jgi:catechol 2,3-dioxygenase-like lactoylglutathione lyase family enzyme
MKIIGADHTSYTVSNLERSLEFYVDLLGFEVLWQREITNQYFRDIVGFPDGVVKAAHLRIPGSTHKLELFEYVVPAGSPADVRTNNPGSSHMAFLVEDLSAAYEALKAKGVQFRSPPTAIDAGANKGAYSLYMLDPDGISVELLQPPKTGI